MHRAPDDETRVLLAQLRDPNLRFPARPRLVPDLHTFQMPDGLGMQFRGAEQPAIVRGRLAGAALEFLLPRLDGTRTLEDFLRECPPDLPRPTLLRALSLLHGKGLLIGDRAAPVDAGGGDAVLQRQALFWGRHLDLTRGAGSADETQRRLATARVVLVGTGLFGLAVHDLLARSGCAGLWVLAWDDDGSIEKTLGGSPVPPRDVVRLAGTSIDEATGCLRCWIADADLLVTATRDAPAALFRAVNRLCLSRAVPWLRGNVDGSRADVGPLVQPFNSGCYHCLELREASMREFAVEEHLYQEHLATERPAAESAPRGEAVWASTLVASLLVAEVVRVLTGIAAPTLLDSVLQVLPVSGTLQTHRFLRVPRCPDCYRGAIAPHPVGAGGREGPP